MIIITQLKKFYLTIRSGDQQPKKQSLTCSLHRTLLSYVTFVVLKLTSLYTFICDKTNFECCLSVWDLLCRHKCHNLYCMVYSRSLFKNTEHVYCWLMWRKFFKAHAVWQILNKSHQRFIVINKVDWIELWFHVTRGTQFKYGIISIKNRA